MQKDHQMNQKQSKINKVFESQNLGEVIFDKMLSIPTMTAWWGLGGSNDKLWAGVYLINLYNATSQSQYLNQMKQWNGVRGVLQIRKEAEWYLDTKNGGVFWDSRRRYKSTISNALYILFMSEYYKITGD